MDISGDSSAFDKRFFISDLGSPPDAIIHAIEAGNYLTTLERLNKDGSRSKTSANLHAWIDACMGHPGLRPISKAEYETLCTMSRHMMAMEIDPGTTVADIIGFCQWQVPIFWESDGIQKKALVDLLLYDGYNYYPFDLKAYASLSMFERCLKTKGWIQTLHYSEGCHTVFGGKFEQPMKFWVAEKSEPYLARQFELDRVWYEMLKEKYNELCFECDQWIKEGKPERGWLRPLTVKGWL